MLYYNIHENEQNNSLIQKRSKAKTSVTVLLKVHGIGNL